MRATAKPKYRLFDKHDEAFLVRPFEQLSRKPEEQFRSADHGKWIRSLPCMICGRPRHVAAAHVRKGTDGATGVKPSDFYENPLCDGDLDEGRFFGCHNRQHKMGEVTFWNMHGGLERAIEHALSIAECSPCDRTRKAAAAVLSGRPWQEAFNV